ncbi:28S ribosomal protein S7, mitochondrial [Diorhabda carinulata]|uniref:28S ribosomal protein S7, mitochondrial n=1 Tax=Diorhabda carinulata TaxID=1163345 RepID=UPI0025A2EC65|nr:28S ribosomal protein S7, mitochondrial [Diorhabda carinulata]
MRLCIPEERILCLILVINILTLLFHGYILKMFTLRNLFLRTNLKTLSNIVQQNGMSQYPSYYIKPVYIKEAQEELIKSGEFQKLSHLPTRAALSDQTCSLAHDPLVNLMINYCMKEGNKVLARSLLEQCFEDIKRLQLEKYHKAKSEEEKLQINLNPRDIFHKAVENCKPLLQLTPIKRGGIKYQVPVPITEKRAQFLSMKWLIAAANDKDRPVRFHLQLARELIDASNNTGRVIKRKQDLHKQCEANRAYAHYRWS